VELSEGDKLVLECSFSGTDPNIEWFFNGQVWMSSDGLNGQVWMSSDGLNGQVWMSSDGLNGQVWMSSDG
jgi:hypothetical protein